MKSPGFRHQGRRDQDYAKAPTATVGPFFMVLFLWSWDWEAVEIATKTLTIS